MDQTSYSGKLLQTFTPVTEQFVFEILQKTASESCDLDPIPTKLPYENLDVLLLTITNIINTSLASGVVSPDLKTAITKPLLKEKQKQQPPLTKTYWKNYRPFPSKIPEKVVVHISNKTNSAILSNLPTAPDTAPRPPFYELLMIC